MGDFIAANSTNYRVGRKAEYPVDRLVIHTMEGTFSGTTAWFQQGRPAAPSSAHFLVGRRGAVRQMVRMADTAYHCGSRLQRGWNDRSIGIELEAWAGAAAPPKNLPFARDEFPPEMMSALALLVKANIVRRYPLILLDRAHIVGHAEVPGSTHTDPGTHFPWEQFMSTL